MSESRLAFKDAIARHYKVGRDRAEDCLGDIIKILESDDDPTDQILDRLITHYSKESQ